MGTTLSLTKGKSRDFTLQVPQSDGTPFSSSAPSPFLSTDALSCKVWPGGDSAVLLTPTPTWVDVTSATFLVSFGDSDTSTLDPDTYAIQVYAARSGRTATLFDGSLQVQSAPGTTTPRATYCKLSDLKKLAPWVEKLIAKTDDPTAAGACADAREWFDDLLQRHYRGGGGVTTDYHFVAGISFAGSSAARFANIFRPGTKSSVLQGWLDANRLDVTPQVVKACAYYALGQICEAQPTAKDSSYADLANKYWARAEHQAATITAEIDSDGDGVNDTWIRLGVADTLEG